jgi:hypothetical protein
VAVNKTGTITKGKPELVSLKNLSDACKPMPPVLIEIYRPLTRRLSAFFDASATKPNSNADTGVIRKANKQGKTRIIIRIKTLSL